MQDAFYPLICADWRHLISFIGELTQPSEFKINQKLTKKIGFGTFDYCPLGLSIGFAHEPVDDAGASLSVDPALLNSPLLGEALEVVDFPAHKFLLNWPSM
jgi:hypothetical protein